MLFIFGIFAIDTQSVIDFRLWSQRMAVVMAVTLVPIYVIWFNSEAILLLLGQEAEVAHLASVYLKWVSMGLPAYTFNSISRYVLNSCIYLSTFTCNDLRA